MPAAHPSNEERILRLHRDLGRRLFAYALGMLGDPADAEDVVQDAFLRLSSHLNAEGDDSNLPSWLYRVTTNLAHDIQRRRGRRAEPSPDIEHRTPAGALVTIALKRVFATLDRRDRQLVLLRGLGLSYAEIASTTEIRPTSVGKLLSRALDRFDAAYEREIGNGGRRS